MYIYGKIHARTHFVMICSILLWRGRHKSDMFVINALADTSEEGSITWDYHMHYRIKLATVSSTMRILKQPSIHLCRHRNIPKRRTIYVSLYSCNVQTYLAEIRATSWASEPHIWYEMLQLLRRAPFWVMIMMMTFKQSRHCSHDECQTDAY